MGVVETTTWTCDRCGRIEEKLDVRNWQPDDWAQVRECVPPLSDVGGSDVLGVLCRHCRGDLRGWLAEPPASEGEEAE